jgi:hypothetical protein
VYERASRSACSSRVERLAASASSPLVPGD